jgi:hypothetical protein
VPNHASVVEVIGLDRCKRFSGALAASFVSPRRRRGDTVKIASP